MKRIERISGQLSPGSLNSLIKQQKRTWLTLKENTKRETLRVMSYNLLAPSNAKMHMFKHHRAEDISKFKRFELLSAEILELRPDILCVQELDEDDLGTFSNNISKLNYEVSLLAIL